MRNNRPARRSGRNVFSRLFQGPQSSGVARKAPRRRDVERLEGREMMTATPTTNQYFGDQWYLFANGQLTEFDPTSPTFSQSVAVQGEDINILRAWAQGVTGAGTQIAIVDGGFDLSHEDLVFITAGLSTNLDLLDGDGLPALEDITDFTGTALAGIIGARDNTLGIVGVAHEADLFPIRLSPGAGDAGAPTIDAINAAFRFHAGFIQDGNGDGVPDATLGGALVPIDIDGDGVADGLQQDPRLVTDVYLHTGGFQRLLVPSRVALDLPTGPSTVNPNTQISILEAITDTAIGGRARWIDTNGDGLFTPNEVFSLGSIHVVPAGDDGGRTNLVNPFEQVGEYASSQYDRLANSIYTIAVGAVDYDGRYENPAVGTVSATSESGANVLIVAPSGNRRQDLSTDRSLNSGVVATDPTGDNGANAAPIFNFEFDGDYFPDTNYSSSLTGTEAAAAQVAGVVALMLEANPNLTQRDVQQILLMSARQNDQFDESWIVNQLQTFRDVYEIPQYIYYDLDTDGDGTADIEDAIIPNDEIDPMTGEFVAIRGFFLNDADMALGVPWLFDPANPNPLLVDTTGIFLTDPQPGPPPVQPAELTIVGSNAPIDPVPVVIFAPESVPTDSFGPIFLQSPINVGERTPLEFENGAGFTVSWGYGRYLEEVGYAHGVLDAGLAVELAIAWETHDLYLEERVSVTSAVVGGSTPFRVQPRAFVVQDNTRFLEVPGGINTEDINTGFYDRFFQELETEEITNANDVVIGEVITNAPFYNPDGDAIDGSNRGPTEIPLEFDPSILDDFLSVEWIEFTTEIAAGDVDNLRLAIRSPDGTQTELNGFRPQINAPSPLPQSPQGQQGRFTPSEESIGQTLGPTLLAPDFIENTELFEIGSTDQPDALPAGQAWTWTSNRHWGELFSLQANTLESPPGGGESRADGWTLIVENHGDAEVTFGGQYQVTLHGTRATGNRIQGKIGIDDNQQQVVGTDNDQNFNFNRYVELAELQVEVEDANGNVVTRNQLVVLDDANDSVTYRNNSAPVAGQPNLNFIYKTKDPDTGVEIFYPVVDKQAYLDLDASALLPRVDNFIKEIVDSTQTAIGIPFYNTSVDRFDLEFEIADPLIARNFDYSQESFAAGVTVLATQFITSFDLAGNTVRTASGVQEKFTTGADGNYWFDVEATPEPPPVGTVAYETWLRLFGRTYDYEISLVGVDSTRVLTNAAEADRGYFTSTDPALGAISFDATTLRYGVEIFESPDNAFGETVKIRDVNFLLKVDPALTNVDVTGTVFRDRNADGTQQAGLEESIAGVTVFHDIDGDGALDAGEASGVTNASGAYSLTIAGLTSAQNVTVAVLASTIPAGLEFLNPATGARSLSVTPGADVVSNFTLRLEGGEPAQVTGVVFEDLNQNGLRDAGEFGFSDLLPITVYIDANNNNVFDSGESFDFTDSTGRYLIESDTTGAATVRIVTPAASITQTAPAAGEVVVNLVAGQTIDLASAFGVFDGRIFDFGDLFVDATHDYPTLFADNGARHVVTPEMRLGARVDIDTDGFQSPVRNPNVDGLGDDFSGVDDEDGVRLVSPLVLPSSTIEFDLTAFGDGAVLNAWVDFNNDGDWDDAGEKIFDNEEDLQVADPLNPVARRVSAPTPATVDTSAAFYAARFRWGPAGIGYDGVANAGEVEDYLFAAVAPIVVSGTVRNDIDGDGGFDPTDAAVAGVRVFFDRDLDGVVDADEPRSVTDASGAYRVEINSAINLNVTLRVDTSTLPSGVGPLVPIDGIFSQDLPVSAQVTTNFLVAAPQGVSGLVFNDLDNDGVRDAGEGGFAGALVEVLRDTDSNGSFDTVIASASTNSAGGYSLPLAPVGQYQVRVNLAGTQFVTQTLPVGGVARTVSVNAGAFTTVGDFGLHDAVPTFTLDYGDLIDDATRNFPTTLADNGARHTRVAGVFLGAVAPDADPGTQQSGNATADDNLFSDDEDGVVMASNVVAGSDVLIDVTATGSAADRLHAWIDFNNDGDWADAGERITPAGGVGLTSGATTRLVVNTAGVAIDGAATAYAARFRWGQGIAGFTGLASTGEVEDFLLPRVLTTTSFFDSDFNNDGAVDLLDLDVLGANFGAGPGATRAQGDANGDGNIDLLDLDILGSEFGSSSSASFALATAPGGMPTVELAPAVFEASLFAPALLASPAVSSAIDESLAIGGDGVVADDAVDAALLLWALGSAEGDEEGDEPGYLAESEPIDEVEEAFALADAF